MAKKEKIHMLLWEGRKYYRGDDGCAFAYENLEELLQELFNAGVQCLEPDERKEFATALMNGQIKKTTVIKNYNSNVEASAFEHINEGEVIIYSVVNKNTTVTSYNVFDRKKSKGYCYGMYCRLEPAQELTDEEKNLCLKYMSEKESLAETDRVFNLFAALCTSEGNTWHCYDRSRVDETYRNEEREIIYLGFETTGCFSSVDAERLVRVAKRKAVCANILMKELTGCELKIKGYPENTDFIEGLMSSRYIENNQIEVKEVCAPTKTLKQVFEEAVSENNNISDGEVMAAKVCLKQINLRDPIDFSKLVPLTDLTRVELVWDEKRMLDNNFDKLVQATKDFVLFSNDDDNITIYMWGETEAMYHMLDNDMNKFLKLLLNK